MCFVQYINTYISFLLTQIMQSTNLEQISEREFFGRTYDAEIHYAHELKSVNRTAALPLWSHMHYHFFPALLMP